MEIALIDPIRACHNGRDRPPWVRTAPQTSTEATMYRFPTDSRNQGSAGIARASYNCAMPAASWSFPTIPVATRHKLPPRRHRVTPL
jgi:hypothetical protein